MNEIAIGLCAVNLQERAIPLFEEALRLRPAEAAVSLCNIGNALLEMNREMEALGWYQKSINADPKYISAYMERESTPSSCNLKECVEWYGRALQIDAGNAEGWFGRGSTLLEIGRASAGH